MFYFLFSFCFSVSCFGGCGVFVYVGVLCAGGVLGCRSRASWRETSRIFKNLIRLRILGVEDEVVQCYQVYCIQHHI